MTIDYRNLYELLITLQQPARKKALFCDTPLIYKLNIK
jgi:hypothetical protein